jgi:hypothetical protein
MAMARAGADLLPPRSRAPGRLLSEKLVRNVSNTKQVDHDGAGFFALGEVAPADGTTIALSNSHNS